MLISSLIYKDSPLYLDFGYIVAKVSSTFDPATCGQGGKSKIQQLAYFNNVLFYAKNAYRI